MVTEIDSLQNLLRCFIILISRPSCNLHKVGRETGAICRSLHALDIDCGLTRSRGHRYHSSSIAIWNFRCPQNLISKICHNNYQLVRLIWSLTRNFWNFHLIHSRKSRWQDNDIWPGCILNLTNDIRCQHFNFNLGNFDNPTFQRYQCNLELFSNIILFVNKYYQGDTWMVNWALLQPEISHVSGSRVIS